MFKQLLAITSLALISVGVCAESANTPSKWMVGFTSRDNQGTLVRMSKISPLKRTGDVVTAWSSLVYRDENNDYVTAIIEFRVDCKRKKLNTESFTQYKGTEFQFSQKFVQEQKISGGYAEIYDIACKKVEINPKKHLVFDLSSVDELVRTGIFSLKTYEQSTAPDPMK